MCLILTDDPRHCDGLATDEPWGRAAVDQLAGPAAVLWPAMGGGQTPWITSLDSGRYWRSLVVVGDAPKSQFDLLHQLLRRNPALGPVACLALTGTGFHGHRGRSWAAEAGNIHLSVGLPVNLPATETLPLLIMLPAVAVIDAVQAATGGRVVPGIKWVNDLLVDGRKLGGVLTTTQTRGAVVEAVTLGIGLNLLKTPRVEPTPFVPKTGALCLFTGEDSPGLFPMLLYLLQALEHRHQQLLAGDGRAILRAYRDASVVVGRRVRVWEEATGEAHSNVLAAGRVLSIEPDLTLRIEGHDPPVTDGRLELL